MPGLFIVLITNRKLKDVNRKLIIVYFVNCLYYFAEIEPRTKIQESRQNLKLVA